MFENEDLDIEFHELRSFGSTANRTMHVHREQRIAVDTFAILLLVAGFGVAAMAANSISSPLAIVTNTKSAANSAVVW